MPDSQGIWHFSQFFLQFWPCVLWPQVSYCVYHQDNLLTTNGHKGWEDLWKCSHMQRMERVRECQAKLDGAERDDILMKFFPFLHSSTSNSVTMLCFSHFPGWKNPGWICYCSLTPSEKGLPPILKSFSFSLSHICPITGNMRHRAPLPTFFTRLLCQLKPTAVCISFLTRALPNATIPAKIDRSGSWLPETEKRNRLMLFGLCVPSLF